MFYYYIDEEPFFYSNDLTLLLINRLSTNLLSKSLNTVTYVLFELFYYLCDNRILLLYLLLLYSNDGSIINQ